MKDNRLQTSFENFEAFDVIAGSNYGGWSPRDMCLAMVDHLYGSINQHPDYDRLIRELAETSDDDLSEYVDDYTQELENIMAEDLQDQYLALEWRDNELTVVPCVDSAIDDHRENDRVTEDLPEADSTHHTGETWMTVNDHGSASLYRFVDTVTGWSEIWAVV